MANMTLKEAAALCGGSIPQEYENLTFFGAATDSRTVVPGQLFVALVGDRDGHAFAPMAMERGAAAVLGQHPIEGIPVLVCDEPLKALGDIARGWRERVSAKVVGITGSVGKTTTKEMTACVLGSAYSVHKTSANFNNHIGLPMTVLGIPEDCQTAVTEMGMNHFGEISYLTHIAQPDVAVITNIGTMHIEYLGSREGILQAKLEILEGLRDGGTVIFNGDEPLLRNAAIRQKPLFFGIDTACDLRACDLQSDAGAMRFRVVGMGVDFPVTLPVEGRHHVYDALAAIAVGLTLGIEPERMAMALSAFSNTGDRQRSFMQNGYQIIADCYNAGPESMAAALSVLSGRTTKGSRIAVLGDMLELGVTAQAEHYKLGKLAAEHADMVFAYGDNSRRVVAGAVENGMPAEYARNYTSHAAMAADLKRNAKPGDVLLFKGSHGMHMEKVLEMFLQAE